MPSDCDVYWMSRVEASERVCTHRCERELSAKTLGGANDMYSAGITRSLDRSIMMMAACDLCGPSEDF